MLEKGAGRLCVLGFLDLWAALLPRFYLPPPHLLLSLTREGEARIRLTRRAEASRNPQSSDSAQPADGLLAQWQKPHSDLVLMLAWPLTQRWRSPHHGLLQPHPCATGLVFSSVLTPSSQRAGKHMCVFHSLLCPPQLWGHP